MMRTFFLKMVNKLLKNVIQKNILKTCNFRQK